MKNQILVLHDFLVDGAVDLQLIQGLERPDTVNDKARGKDEFGYRQEFVNLVRLAKSEWAERK